MAHALNQKGNGIFGGGVKVFEIILLLVKVLFALVIYLFIFGIVRLIYLDIKSMNISKVNINKGFPYLKLVNKREYLHFKVEETYILSKNITIGRYDKNDIVIKDSFISGIHAQITKGDSKIYLKDLGSKNGTFINGKKLEEGEQKLLKDGDKMKIGQLEFLFVEGSELV
ncbi:UNVERIFIED_CONTAM: FHA domain protein [Acetivibrio alkalicellulosi]